MDVPATPHLRPVRPSDLDAFYEHQRDKEAARVAAFSPRDREAFMAHWARILADPTMLARTIVHEGRIAGNIGAFDRDGRRQVGYWIDRALWGRGIATAALARFVEVETARPLHAFVAVANIGSIRVLEKCGFARVEDEELPEPEDGIEEWLFVLR